MSEVLTLYGTIPTFLTHLKKKVFENIVGRGENAGNPQSFLPFQQKISNFQSYLSPANAQSPILSFAKGLIQGNRLNLYRTIPRLNNLRKRPFENIVRKGEKAGNQHNLFSFYSNVFYPIKENFLH